MGTCVRRCVEDLFESVSALGDELEGLDGDGLAGRLVALERIVRRAEAAIVAVLDEADRRGAWKVDGHASVRGWARATVRWSDVEVRDRVRTVTLCRDAPAVHAELAAGRLGVAQVRELARARPTRGSATSSSTPSRCWSSTPSTCRSTSSRPVCSAGSRWPTSTAPTRPRSGPCRAPAHASSSATRSTSTPPAASSTARRWSRSCAASSRPSSTPSGTNCAPATATTPARRCSSAPRRSGASTPCGDLRAGGRAQRPVPRPPEPVVNIVVDQATWEAWLARLSDEPPEAPLPDPADVDRRRCETIDGVPVDPADVVSPCSSVTSGES